MIMYIAILNRLWQINYFLNRAKVLLKRTNDKGQMTKILTVHCKRGIVKKKVLPLPNLLSTQILPP